jgi:Proto-chlorophyllide reductase 57 kD subunit
MKFLCVPCDSPMKLQTVSPDDRGSLSVVYSCPECGYEMAMLTNSFETQMVQSLGVRIGPPSTALGASSSSLAAEATEAPAGRCPFGAMLPTKDGALGDAAHAKAIDPDQPKPVRWTAAAEARLENVPAFVRPMARAGIEQFARDNGSVEVDEHILDAARAFFGM